MPTTRRRLVIAMLAATGFGVAACASPVNRRSRGRGLDLQRLAHGYEHLQARASPGTLAFGVMTLDSPAVWSSDPHFRAPLQSVFKAPLAAAAP